MSSMYDLDLNTNILHEDSTTYQSLLEKNRIDIFTKEHIKERKQYEMNLKKKEDNILNALFVKQTVNNNMNDIYATKLFQKPMVIDKQKSYQNNIDHSTQIVVIGTIVLTICFLIVMIRYFKRSNKKMEESYE